MRYRLTFVTFSALCAIAACGKSSSTPSGGYGTPVSIGGSIGAITGGSTTSNTSSQDANSAGVFELLPGNSGGGGSATFTGTVGGDGLTPTSAVFDIIGDSQGNPLAAYIILASDGNFCDDFVQNTNQIANSTHTTIELFTTDASDNVQILDTTQGFVVSSDPNQTGNIAGFDFLPQDGNCNVALPNTVAQGTSGTINITQLSVTTVTGNFTATMGDSNQVSGTFQASPCPGIAAVELSQNVTLGCQ